MFGISNNFLKKNQLDYKVNNWYCYITILERKQFTVGVSIILIINICKALIDWYINMASFPVCPLPLLYALVF